MDPTRALICSLDDVTIESTPKTIRYLINLFEKFCSESIEYRKIILWIFANSGNYVPVDLSSSTFIGIRSEVELVGSIIICNNN